MSVRSGSAIRASEVYQTSLGRHLYPVVLQEAANLGPPLTAGQGQTGCPQMSGITVSRFPQYQQSAGSLPLEEREKINHVARAIVASFRRGCRPVATVRLVGHADRDVRRGPAFERKISLARAWSVRDALITSINNQLVARRIHWQTEGVGSLHRVVLAPVTEQQRALNRRVDIVLVSSVPPRPDDSAPRINACAQSSLRRLLQGDLAAQTDARGMVTAVKAGQLAGIYKEDDRVPGLLAQKLHLDWRRLIPPQEDAALIIDPINPSAPPLIDFRASVCLVARRLDPALRKAWKTFLQWRAGRVVKCPISTLGPARAELSGSFPVSNLAPQGIFCQLVAPGPTQTLLTMRSGRTVGNGGTNIREEVRNTMDRLHVLWSITNSDYGAEYPGVSARALGSIVPSGMIPRTAAAIRRNFDPTLHPAVAANLLNISIANPVGRNQKNDKADILSLQTPLHALGLLGDADFTVEQRVVRLLRSATVPDASIPQTLQALTSLKDKIAGGRLGWAPIRADEDEAGGDRLGGRTFDFTISSVRLCPAGVSCDPVLPVGTAVVPFGVSIFVPRGAKPDVNKVHVFFSPGNITGDTGLNATLMHGLRGASDSSAWILISVPGIEHGWCTIDRASISSCLTRVGRSPEIHALRLSGHSRGGSGLRESIARGFFRGSIDRIFILDASDAFGSVSIAEALRRGRSSAGRIVQYAVNLPDLPGAENIRMDKFCVRAIGYTRLIQDAMTTRPTLVIPSVVRDQLLSLPPRGAFTTLAASAAGRPNIRTDCKPRAQTCFCHDQAARIAAIVRNQSDPRVGLRTFIEGNGLTRFGRSFAPEIYSHHMFVAEIAHELVS